MALIFEAALECATPTDPTCVLPGLASRTPAIFQEAFRRSGAMDMVMIGDQIETDIRGANDFGIASALISTGISGYDATRLPQAERPDYLIESLAI